MDNEYSLVGHIAELRRRLLVCLAVVLGLACVTFYFASVILTALQIPAAGLIDRLVFFSPTEAFSAYLKVAFFSALFLASPVILWQAWEFIAPALEPVERRHGAQFVLFAVIAFLGGVAFGYFCLFPAAIRFLLGFAAGTLQPIISVSEYISFVIALLLACGLIFQMPVLSYILSKVGILDHRILRRCWRQALVVILILAAVVTPTQDPFNMLMLALPMLLLYEVSIWIARLNAPKQQINSR